jgi:hypothetical protein
MKKKTNFWITPLLLLGVFLILASSCKKDDEENTDSGNNNHFTAKVDGVAWSSASSELIGVLVTTDEYLFVSGATSDDNEIITINFFDFPGTTGTYNMGTGEYDFHCFYTIAGTSYFVFDDVPASTGTLVITAMTDNSIKGTFSFIGFNNAETASVTVTDGSFELPLYNETP